MIVTFKHNGIIYNDWNIADTEIRQQLESKGIDLVPIAKQELQKQILELQNKRVQNELQSRNWLDYGDVLESALDTNDPDNAEAKAIQAWYKAYYTEIDKVIATINGKRSIDTLLALDLNQLEEQAFQNAVATNPLP